MERVAPRQVLYEEQLPLAIESTSQRRIFFPEGGSTYGPSGGGTNPNIIRIPINSDDLLNPLESYLQFKLTNLSSAGLAPDIGVPFIRRLRIESSGTTLEDINEYGTLYAQLLACQASQGGFSEATLTTSGLTALNGTGVNIGNTYAQTDGAVSTVILGAMAGAGADQQAIANAKAAATTVIRDAIRAGGNAQTTTVTVGGNHPAESKIATGGSVFYNIPLVSALLNCKKYLPLVFMNGGIVLELEIDIAESAGSYATFDNGGFSISDVRYMAHMVTLQRDFYDKLRMVMEGSGGVLQLAGTTYRHFQSSFADATSASLPLPAKVKSMKGLLFTEKNQADIGKNDAFYVSNSLINGTNEYQLRVGSMTYPPTSVKIDNNAAGVTNKGEAYQELRKLFGTLGDYTHGGVLLNNATYMAGAPSIHICQTGGAATRIATLNPKGLSLESFTGNLESGINSADKNLSMSLELRRSNQPGTPGGQQANAITTRVDMFAMCDAIFYVNLDGSVSSSV